MYYYIVYVSKYKTILLIQKIYYSENSPFDIIQQNMSAVYNSKSAHVC